ncbi:MAG: ATP-dependent RNA helicase RhlE [Planctomycetota bacterium]
MASKGQNPRALILAPTRELAIQIHAEIELLGKYTNIRAMTVFGGVGAAPQIRSLRSRPDIVVACPGRLLDLMGSGDARLDGIEVLVLDEADHMLDMGFLPDIKRILSRLPQRRQNLLFSATMPREIRSLTDNLLRNPHKVELAITAPAETIAHALYPVDQANKTALLKHLFGSDDFKSAIVFLRTKHRAKRLAKDLEKAGYNAIALQGNMSQNQRQNAMQGFRDGSYNVLVATDIAARGIDVAHVSHVINFDIPNTPDAYTHRIGRTGRAERSGQAFTFVTHEDFPSIKAIEKKLQMAIPRVKLRDYGEGTGDANWDRREPRGQGGRGGNRGGGGGRPTGRSRIPSKSKTGRADSSAPKAVAPKKAVEGKTPATKRETAPAGPAGPSFGAGVGAWDAAKKSKADGGGRSRSGGGGGRRSGNRR